MFKCYKFVQTKWSLLLPPLIFKGQSRKVNIHFSEKYITVNVRTFLMICFFFFLNGSFYLAGQYMHTMCEMLVTVWQLMKDVYYLSLHKTHTVLNYHNFLVTYHNGTAETLAGKQNAA